ncbi:MAG: type II secretion system protein [Armatimonadetes bacterium]|nr:type II secretion system protein [Armatimonadota bacterium]
MNVSVTAETNATAGPQRGFTVIELLVALSMGALVWLLVFRAFTLAVAAQGEAQRDLAAQQQARAVLQWMASAVQATSEVRAAGETALELAGTFDLERGAECRGFYAAQARPLPVAVLYERRRAPCPGSATSEGGDALVVSDPNVSIAALTFRYFNEIIQPTADPGRIRLVEITVGIDTDRDGRPDYRLVQLAGLRTR